MNQPTLGLLENLSPPQGFRTAAALGTSYSADLLTCMAVLTTMDGGHGEKLQYGRVEAYRALDHLRDKVRICYHAGRLAHRDGAKYPSLALLDRVLIPIRLPAGGSFHPKVWLVRQLDEVGLQRFVLIVSSRNITTSTDWDLGMVLEGTLAGRGVVLPAVREFASHVLEMAGEPERIQALGDLDAVRWKLPPRVRELQFGFQAGSDSPRKLHQEWTTFLANPSRVLLLSPFIDGMMIREAARRWRHVGTRTLVAGTQNLLTVALSDERAALLALNPRQMVGASEVSSPAEVETLQTQEDEIDKIRSLHAKVIALDDGVSATVILGSSNLTSPGWCGGSTEAYLRLVGDAALCEPLWDWASGHAELFDCPITGQEIPAPPILEDVKNKLHAIKFRLEDSASGEPSRLVVLEPPKIELPVGVVMEVARYTTPKEFAEFPSGTNAVNLSGCQPALRTRFVVCRLRSGDEEASWIAAADVMPALGDLRDRELVAQLLGLRQFLAFVHSLRSDDVIDGTIEGDSDDESMRRTSKYGPHVSIDSVNLEGLLKQLVSDPRAFHEMDRAVSRYGELIKKGQHAPADLVLLDGFLDAWGAISTAFHQ